MKRLVMILLCLALLPSMTSAERVYVSRLGDESILLNQRNTGVYSDTNCAPTSLGIIYNYLKIPYKNVHQIRLSITGSGGLIYTNEVEDYLDISSVPYSFHYVYSEEDLIGVLNSKGMVLLCVSTGFLTPYTGGLTGRQYYGSFGHYLVVSGYYKDDNRCYFEVLDPMNYEVRYYKSQELLQAITNWWSYALVFHYDDVNNRSETEMEE